MSKAKRTEKSRLTTEAVTTATPWEHARANKQLAIANLQFLVRTLNLDIAPKLFRTTLVGDAGVQTVFTAPGTEASRRMTLFVGVNIVFPPSAVSRSQLAMTAFRTDPDVSKQTVQWPISTCEKDENGLWLIPAAGGPYLQKHENTLVVQHWYPERLTIGEADPAVGSEQSIQHTNHAENLAGYLGRITASDEVPFTLF